MFYVLRFTPIQGLLTAHRQFGLVRSTSEKGTNNPHRICYFHQQARLIDKLGAMHIVMKKNIEAQVVIVRYNRTRGFLVLMFPVIMTLVAALISVSIGAHRLNLQDLADLEFRRKVKILAGPVALCVYYYVFFVDSFRALTSAGYALKITKENIALFDKYVLNVQKINKIIWGKGPWGPFVSIYLNSGEKHEIKTAFLDGGLAGLIENLTNLFPNISISES